MSPNNIPEKELNQRIHSYIDKLKDIRDMLDKNKISLTHLLEGNISFQKNQISSIDLTSDEFHVISTKDYGPQFVSDKYIIHPTDYCRFNGSFKLKFTRNLKENKTLLRVYTQEDALREILLQTHFFSEKIPKSRGELGFINPGKIFIVGDNYYALETNSDHYIYVADVKKSQFKWKGGIIYEERFVSDILMQHATAGMPEIMATRYDFIRRMLSESDHYSKENNLKDLVRTQYKIRFPELELKP